MRDQKQQEPLVITNADAIVNPDAMVVETRYAGVAEGAML